MRPSFEELSHLAPIYVSSYPNAGLPNPMLPTGFPETPETLAPQLTEWAQSGWLNIVGGCCGTTPAHIAAIARGVKAFPPRQLPAIPRALRLSGLEALTIRPAANFVNIGERTNVTGSPKFAKLILRTIRGGPRRRPPAGRKRRPDIDINMDEGMLDGAKSLAHFLNLVASEPDNLARARDD